MTDKPNNSDNRGGAPKTNPRTPDPRIVAFVRMLGASAAESDYARMRALAGKARNSDPERK